MEDSRANVAKIGETLAVEHLKARGCEILERNYRALRGEIDIIAQEGDFTVFVEVKTRRSLRFGVPEAAVTLRKQRQISKVAAAYLQAQNLWDAPCRFDVIAIHLSSRLQVLRLEQIENAFEFQVEPEP